MIRLELPGLPPSANNAYTNNGFGGRTLSTKGRAFKRLTTAHLAQKYPREMMLFKADKPFVIAVRFYFEDVENKGFASGKAKARYKVADGDNRMKLLADSLKDAGGIDDSQTVMSAWEKVQGMPERTVIWAWSLEEESSPLHDLFQHLP